MAFRFSNPGAPPVPAGGWAGTNLIFDRPIGRWRWAFQAVLEQTRERQGRDLTGAEAVAAVGPELSAALGYIASQPPDDNVFGIVYSSPAPARVPAANDPKGATSIKNALTTLDKALSPGTPDFLRSGLLGGAVNILQGVLRDHAPNDLSAAGALVRSLHAARRPLEALAEWAQLYGRAVSAASVFQRVSQNDHPTRARVALAYKPFLTTLLPDLIESHAVVLGAHRLYDPARLAALPLLPSALDDMGSYIETYHVNWLHMVCESRHAMAFFQLGVGTVLRLKGVLPKYFECARNWGLQTYPARMKRTLVRCVGALEPLLVKDIPGPQATEIRVKVCETLAEITLQETLEALRKHRQHPEAAVRKAVEDAIGEITSRIGAR